MVEHIGDEPYLFEQKVEVEKVEEKKEDETDIR